MSIERAAHLTEKQCREIAGTADANHIWVNAFTLIDPSDETLLAIGRTVVNMLKQRGNLLPARADHDCKLAKLTPVLYMSINQS